MVIKQLTYLAALARERHFGRAAAACNVSQPALSAGIRQLEDELGVPIVARGQRFQGFTAEGARVLDWAHRILADCEAMRQELSEITRELSGWLRIGVVPSALPAVARHTAPFARRHPRVRLTILSMSSAEIQRALDAFEIDAGLTYLDNEPLARVRAVPLYRERYFLLVGAADPLADRETVPWVEVARRPLALLTGNMQNRRIVDDVFRAVGADPAPPTVETNSLLALAGHVREGPWASVVPEALIEGLGPPPGTRAVPIVAPEITHVMGLVMADREPAAPLARALFAEILTEGATDP